MIITTRGVSYELTTEAQLIAWLTQQHTPEEMAKFLATLPHPVKSSHEAGAA